jgi:regulator of sigma E protease
MSHKTNARRSSWGAKPAGRGMVLLTLSLPLLAAGLLTHFINGFGQVALVIIGFGVLVFFHELGHFLAAKAFKIRCDVFSLGIGPRLCGWRKGRGFSFGTVPIGPPASVGGEAAHLAASQKLGETDYRIAWLPFGGYVRMLGQDDLDPTKVSSDPASFANKPIWQRMIVISAGVVMNLILAFIIFVVVFRVGVPFEPAVIGGVEYGSPAMKAGLQVGDRVIAINNHKPLGFLEFSDLKMASALDTPGKPIKITYIPVSGGKPRSVKVVPTMSKSSGFLMFGVAEPQSLKVPRVNARQLPLLTLTQPILAKVKPGSTIAQINGKAISTYGQLYHMLQDGGGRPVTLTMRSDTGGRYSVRVTPTLVPAMGIFHFPSILGCIPLMEVDGIVPNSGAQKAGLKPGDVIVRLGTITDPDWKQIRRMTGDNAGQSMSMKIWRRGKTKTLVVHVGRLDGKGFLGIEATPAYNTNIFGRIVGNGHHVYAGEAFDAVGVVNPEAVGTTAIRYTPVKNWLELYSFAVKHPNAHLALRLVGHRRPLVVANTGKAYADLKKLHFSLALPLNPLTEIQKTSSFATALAMGIDHTVRWITNTYLTLRGLGIGTVSPSQLHGVVGVAAVSYQLESQGLMYLLYFMGLISVNLAVINFLPLPILDGGLFVMLLLEKIRGRPLPLKVQAGIQIVGLILIGGVFLYVTLFNDLPMIFHH